MPPELPKEITIREWLAEHAVSLIIVLGLTVFLFIKFDWDGLWAIAKAVIGLSFVVFIHEMGHFLVAKWCDVHVEMFSIGFGPALPGCRYKWGETTYKLAIIPLGGYVQMVGQVDGDESADGSENDPRSYRNKTVLQRMGIISAGVIMNVILAAICFVIVFQVAGKDRIAAVVDRTDTYSPAYLAGLRTGSVIRQVGDIEQPYFEQLRVVVMTSQKDDEILLKLKRPIDREETTLSITPRLDPNDKLPVIGITTPARLELASRTLMPKTYANPTALLSAASRAQPPLEFGDTIVAMTDPGDPNKITELPRDPRKPNSDQRDYFIYLERMQQLAGKEVTLLVERKTEGGSTRQEKIVIPPSYQRTFGACMEMGEITAMRLDSPADKAKVQVRKKGTVFGDVIQRVEVHEPDGQVTRFMENPPTRALEYATVLLLPTLAQPAAMHDVLNHNNEQLDPVRLPRQLKLWARRIAANPAPAKQEWEVKLYVRRHNKLGKDSGAREFNDNTELTLTWDPSWEYDRATPMQAQSPLAIPELGLAYQIKGKVAGIDPRWQRTVTAASAKDAATLVGPQLSTDYQKYGLQAGDLIVEARFSAQVDAKGTVQTGKWVPVIEGGMEELQKRVKGEAKTARTEYLDHHWAVFDRDLQDCSVAKVELKVWRNEQEVVLTLTPETDATWPSNDRGLVLAPDVRRQKASNFAEAVAMGMHDTHNHVMQVFLNLRGMLTGRISPTNLGGPLTIAQVAYRVAGIDFWEFLFFLGMISVNLAVINFLPIPVLDGGHMVFLLYEKVRGQPASESVRNSATYAGLLMIACLMLFVLYLDVGRLMQ